jgi:hypothetical protein
MDGDYAVYILTAIPQTSGQHLCNTGYVYIDNGYTTGKIEVTQLGWQR